MLRLYFSRRKIHNIVYYGKYPFTLNYFLNSPHEESGISYFRRYSRKVQAQIVIAFGCNVSGWPTFRTLFIYCTTLLVIIFAEYPGRHLGPEIQVAQNNVLITSSC